MKKTLQSFWLTHCVCDAQAKALFANLLGIPEDDIPFHSAFAGQSLLDHWTHLLESEQAPSVVTPRENDPIDLLEVAAHPLNP